MIDLSLDLFGVFACFPHFEPVSALVIFASVDDLEHVLSWVLIYAASTRSVVLKVVQQCLGVLTNFAEVNSLAPSCL